ncbi:MAG: HAMP domain-containing sensor histidine kinase, partial [Bacteroidota bacterium]
FSAFTLVIFLIIGIFLIYEYFNDRIEEKLNAWARIELNISKSSQLAQSFFLYETINPDFYKNGKSLYLEQQKKLYDTVMHELDILKRQSLLRVNNIQAKIDKVKNKIIAAEQLFDNLIVVIRRRGFKDDGLEGEMRKLIHEIENYQDQLSLASILTIRRHEKDFILRKQDGYIEKLSQAVDELKREIEAGVMDPEMQSKLNKLLNLYATTFYELVNTEKKIGFQGDTGLRGELTQLLREINTDIQDIVLQVGKRASKTRKNLRVIIFVLFMASFALVSLAGFFVARMLGEPINRLSQSILEVIASNFSGQVQVPHTNRNDEIGRLASDFNFMYEKLIDHNEEIMSQRNLLQQQNETILSAQNEIKEANAELEALNANLEQMVAERTQKLVRTNEELDLFIYRASHDLKGPLARLLGLTQLGKIESQDPKAQEYFDRLQNNVEIMDGLLDKLLMINVITQEIRRFRKVTFQDVWGEVEATLARLILDKQPNIQVSIHFDKPFFSDKSLLILILQNLVENALVYHDLESDTPPQIEIDFAIDSQRHCFILKVKDQGIGIEEAYRDKIFNMFFRGTEMSQTNGLGLYIVKKAVEGLEGEIYLDSELNQYTCFEILLPHRTSRKKVIQYD